MRFVLVAHRSSDTNTGLVRAARECDFDALVAPPQDALRLLGAGDIAVGRLDVLETVDGIERGTTELERLAATGVNVLNPPRALAATHDKLLTARALRLAGLPHPRTWLLAEGMPSPAPELPLVLKPRFGSWGRNVERCFTPDDLDRALAQAARTDWFREHGALAQELVPSLGPGWDLRLVVAGGRVVGAVRRVAAHGEWRTNVSLGARVEPIEPPPLARQLAIAAAAAVHADLAGVDLLPTQNGFVVLEVNGAVDFRPIYAPERDVYTDAVLALLMRIAEHRVLVA